MNKELELAFARAMVLLKEIQEIADKLTDLKKVNSTTWRMSPPSGTSNISNSSQMDLIGRGRDLLVEELNEKLKQKLTIHNFSTIPQEPKNEDQPQS